MKKKRPELQNEKNKRSVRAYQSDHKNRWNWYRITGTMAAVAVLLTVYWLILPAITMERTPVCGKEEHVHTEECYETLPLSALLCEDSLSDLHQHTDECYDSSGQLICGYADFVLHTHDESCYNSDGLLICPLEENTGHQHSDACYETVNVPVESAEITAAVTAENVSADAFTDDPFDDGSSSAFSDGEVYTGTADTDSYTSESVLICQEAESCQVHTHDTSCYIRDDGSVSITPCCGKLEIREHVHSDSCFPEAEKALVCEKEEHKHSDFCYEEEDETEETDAQEVKQSGTDEITYETIEADSEDEPAAAQEVVFDEGIDSEETADSAAGTVDTADEKTDIDSEKDAENTGDSEDNADIELYSDEDTDVETDMDSLMAQESDQEIEDLVEMEVDSEGIATYMGDGETNSIELPNDANHIESAKLYYKLATTTADVWTELTDETTDIPANVTVKLEVHFQNLNIEELLTVDGNFTYTLPELLRKPQASGYINFGSKTVGTVNADGTNTLKLNLDTTWLNEVKNDNKYVKGEFYVTAQFNFEEITEETPGQLVIGGTTFTINFDGDFKAKYATVDLSKSQPVISEEETGDYLIYSLTVTAGEDGCDDVTVIDKFPSSGQSGYQSGNAYVKNYVGVTGVKTAISEIDSDSTGLSETISTAGGTSGSVYLAKSYTTPSSGQGYTVGSIPEEAGADYSDRGVLVWEIGNMAANETRVLTYKVRLQDEQNTTLTTKYTGADTKGNIRNNADVYSGTYLRKTTYNQFVPKAGNSFSKYASSPVKNEDGSYTVTYYVTCKMNDDNSYTMDNVKLLDYFRFTNSNYQKFNQYVTYVEGSFHLYNGYIKSWIEGSNLGGEGYEELSFPENPNSTESTPKSNPDLISDIRTDSESRGYSRQARHFTVYFGDLEPGAARTLVYQVNVEPAIFLELSASGTSNGSGTVGQVIPSGQKYIELDNRAQLRYDDRRIADGTGSNFNGYMAGAYFSEKVWDRKLVGDRMTESKEINTGSETFTVPVGSFQYQIAINEAGDWDVSSMVMEDTLNGAQLQFVGYVRVDAYKISSNAPTNNKTDQQVIDYFNSLGTKGIDHTLWYKIDGKSSFSFKPSEIGGKEGNFAYKLTYYAEPVNIGPDDQVEVTNDVKVYGTVGAGKYTYTLSGITASASVLVKGSGSFGTDKVGWYYEKPMSNEDTGKLYWVIKVDGDTIRKGTKLKDQPTWSNANNPQSILWLNNQCEVAFYTGSFGDQSITDYEDLNAVLESGKLTQLDHSYYRCKDTDEVEVKSEVTDDIADGDDKDTRASSTNNSPLYMTILKDIELQDGDSLYIIVKTTPLSKITAKRDAKTFTNTLSYSVDGGTEWIEGGDDQITAYGSENIFKDLGGVITYDAATGTATNIYNSSANAGTEYSGTGLGNYFNSEVLSESGTYIIWNIKINYEGNLSGRYRVIDHIPEGLEVACLRAWSIGGKAMYGSLSTAKLSEAELEELGGGWTEHYISNFGSNAWGAAARVYSYTKGQELLFDVTNLQAGGVKDGYSIQYQLLCRVTDQDALLSGDQVVFNNTVDLLNSDGENVGSDYSAVSLSRTCLSKKGTYSGTAATYPFQITVNDIGEDLVENGTTITLYDELGSSLIYDSKSIQITNSNTGDVLVNGTDYIQRVEEGSDGKTIVSWILPDNLPLTITYSADVTAAPGDQIDIQNIAHWEGYEAPKSSSFQVSNFEYSVGGKVDIVSFPKVQVMKMDQDNTSKYLPGATFTVQEVEYNEADGTFTPTGDYIWTGTTDEEGSVTFGNIGTGDPNNNQHLEHNKIYCLKEVKAPTGYALDSTPRYFVVAERDENNEWPVFPSQVKVDYTTDDYVIQVYDAVSTYVLPITGGSGIGHYRTEGLFLAVATMICLAVQNRKSARKVRAGKK